jgi:hypothetical protein
MGYAAKLKSLNRVLKGYDSKLYAVVHREPRIDVYRKADFSLSPPHLIFSLTEDWTVNSAPRDWGLEVIMARVKAHDIWRDDTYLDRILEENQKVDESVDRARKNDLESFLYDMAPKFARATNDVNTSLLKTPGVYTQRARRKELVCR